MGESQSYLTTPRSLQRPETGASLHQCLDDASGHQVSSSTPNVRSCIGQEDDRYYPYGPLFKSYGPYRVRGANGSAEAYRYRALRKDTQKFWEIIRTARVSPQRLRRVKEHVRRAVRLFETHTSYGPMYQQTPLLMSSNIHGNQLVREVKDVLTPLFHMIRKLRHDPPRALTEQELAPFYYLIGWAAGRAMPRSFYDKELFELCMARLFDDKLIFGPDQPIDESGKADFNPQFRRGPLFRKGKKTLDLYSV